MFENCRPSQYGTHCYPQFYHDNAYVPNESNEVKYLKSADNIRWENLLSAWADKLEKERTK